MLRRSRLVWPRLRQDALIASPPWFRGSERSSSPPPRPEVRLQIEPRSVFPFPLPILLDYSDSFKSLSNSRAMYDTADMVC